jgi:hypothetical protein
MIVTEHRSPLKRIDYAIKPRAPEPAEAEHIKAARDLDARIANERMWRLLRQSAEGCNPAGEA